MDVITAAVEVMNRAWETARRITVLMDRFVVIAAGTEISPARYTAKSVFRVRTAPYVTRLGCGKKIVGARSGDVIHIGLMDDKFADQIAADMGECNR